MVTFTGDSFKKCGESSPLDAVRVDPAIRRVGEPMEAAPYASSIASNRLTDIQQPLNPQPAQSICPDGVPEFPVEHLTQQHLVCYSPFRPKRLRNRVQLFMRCPKCGNLEDKVIDSRSSKEGSTIRRRRECLECAHRFTTYEEIEHGELMVVKSDGRREPFSREKLLSGIKKACQKREVTPERIDGIVGSIVSEVSTRFDREVAGKEIGERVMDALRDLDDIAYVRYASVYRRFEEATEFVNEVNKLEKKP